MTTTAGDPDLVGRFRAERQIVAGLDHPYIARLLDGGALADGRPYFVMEYVAGQRIDEYVAERKPDTAAVLHLFLKVCAAAQFAHRSLVVHRDLKAGNILVSEDGDPHLLDFGIAKVLDPAAHTNAEITQTLLRRMTPASASPEQVTGKAVTVSTDVYALGILLYRLLTGASAYAEAKGFDANPAQAILEYEPPPASRVPGVPQKLRRVLAGDLDNILRKAIEKEPTRRYASVEEFAADVGRYLQRRPVKARRASALHRARKFLARHRRTVTAGVAAGTIASGAVLLAVWTPRPPRVLRSVQLTHFGFGSGVVATDGTSVYFDARRPSRHGIVRVPVDGGDPVDVPAPCAASLRDISPDRSALLVECEQEQDRRTALWTLSIHGGPPRHILDSEVGSARWSRDGARIALVVAGILCTINADGSALRKLAPAAFLDGWSPDGKLIRFSRVNGSTGGMSLWEVRPDGSQIRPYLPDLQNQAARWGEGEGPGLFTPDGKYFLFREFLEHRTTLWAMRERTRTWHLRRPQPVEVYAAGFDMFPWSPPAVSPDGKRLFVLSESETHDIALRSRPANPGAHTAGRVGRLQGLLSGRKMDGLHDGAGELPLAGETRWQRQAPIDISAGSGIRRRLAAGQQRIGGAHSASGGEAGKDIGRAGGRRKTKVLFENEPTAEDSPAFSPDGQTMGFGRTWLDAQGNTIGGGMWLLDRRSGKISKLSETDDDLGAPVWSPDGSRMAAERRWRGETIRPWFPQVAADCERRPGA